MHQSIGLLEALPRVCFTAIAINNPSGSSDEIVMDLQVLINRDSASARVKLDQVNDVQWQSSDRRQLESEGRFSTARIPENGHSLHESKLQMRSKRHHRNTNLARELTALFIIKRALGVVLKAWASIELKAARR